MKNIIKLSFYTAIYLFRKALGNNWDVEQILLTVVVFGIVVPLYLWCLYLQFSNIDFANLW